MPAHRLCLPTILALASLSLVSCEDEKTKTALAEAEDRLITVQKNVLRLENELKKEQEVTEKNVRELQQQNNELQKAAAETKAQFATLEESVRKAKAELEVYRSSHPLGQSGQ